MELKKGRWTEYDKVYLKNNYNGKNAEKLAHELKRSVSGVYIMASKLGLTDGDKYHPNKAEPKEWRRGEVKILLQNKKRKNGGTLKDMSVYLGRSVASITSKLAKYDITKEKVKIKATQACSFLYDLGFLDEMEADKIDKAIWKE